MDRMRILKSIHVLSGVSVRQLDLDFNVQEAFLSGTEQLPEYGIRSMLGAVELEEGEIKLVSGSFEELFVLARCASGYVLFGPFRCGVVDRKGLERRLAREGTSPADRQALCDYLCSLPRYCLSDVRDIAIHLNYCLAGKLTDPLSRGVHTFVRSFYLELENEQAAAMARQGAGGVAYQSAYEGEILERVRSGGAKDLKDMVFRLDRAAAPAHTGSTLRSEKNYSVVVFEKLAHTAIEAGVDVVGANSARDSFVRRTEQADTLQTVLRLRNAAIVFFTAEIGKIRQKAYSRLVTGVMQFVGLNIRRQLRAGDVAEEFHLSASSLQKRFKAETGTTLQCYIRDRKIEECVPQLESMIHEKSQKSWAMGQLSPEDIRETLAYEFNAYIGELSELFPQPLNVLHLVMLVKQLRRNNIMRLSSIKALASFSGAYQAVNSQNNQFAKHKIKLAKYQKEIYLIYKTESGIPKDILFGFWGADANIIYSELVSQNLVKEDNGRVIPFHDAYLYAFFQQEPNSNYLNEVIHLLNYIRKLEKTYPTLESNLISILITDGDMSIPDLRESAYQYCREYYNIAQYYAAKVIAQSLLPDVDTAGDAQFTEDMFEILYIYAQSVKFTESHVRSTKLFRKLIQITSKNNISPEVRDMGLDALSEVLNNEMWMLNFDETSKCIEKLSKLNISASTTIYGENAYLNYLNRKMMCESFSTSHDCHDSYKTALSESKRLKRSDYEAYAKMDCARILYPTSPHKSLDLLDDARTFFVVNRKYYRRLLECNAEIIFLKTLLHGKSFDELYKIQKEMLSQGYINSYTKTTVKILTLEVSIGAIPPETARIRLNRLTLQNPDAIINKRISIAIYQLLALCAYIDRNESDLSTFAKKHLKIVLRMNESYTCIPRHNLSCPLPEKKLSWFIGENMPEDSFWLDPRLW